MQDSFVQQVPQLKQGHIGYCFLLSVPYRLFCGRAKSKITGQCLHHCSHGSGFWWAENKYIVGDWTDEQTNWWTRVVSRVIMKPERAPAWRASGTGQLSLSLILWICSFPYSSPGLPPGDSVLTIKYNNRNFNKEISGIDWPWEEGERQGLLPFPLHYLQK